jgi:hypothetical protein
VIFVTRSNNCGPWKIVTASNVKSKRRSHLFVKSEREVVQFAAGSVQGSLLLKSGRFDPSLKLSLSLWCFAEGCWHQDFALCLLSHTLHLSSTQVCKSKKPEAKKVLQVLGIQSVLVVAMHVIFLVSVVELFSLSI